MVSEPASPTPTVLVLVRDLLFASKITAAANAGKVSIRILRDPANLDDQRAKRVIVDLNQPGALEAALRWKRSAGGQIIGFVSHVDTETIERARSAGIDQVLPRSRFVQILPDLLK